MFICHQCDMLNCAICIGSLVTCSTCTSSFILPMTLAIFLEFPTNPSVFSHHYQLSQPDYWSHLPVLLSDRLIYFILPLQSWHSQDFSHFPFHFQLQNFKCFHYYQAFIDCMLSSTSAESASIISFCTLWYK